MATRATRNQTTKSEKTNSSSKRNSSGQSAVDVARARRTKRGWTPFAGPQLLAYLADGKVDQIGFGGAGGGGKTDLGLGLALLRHKRSIFYRRQYTQLSGAVDRSRVIYRGRGRYNQQSKRWRLQGGKRLVQFGGMESEADKEKWRGIPFDLRYFDEAQNFLESQVRFVCGWTRTDDPEQHCTEVFGFNPPTTPEGLWIIAFFAPWLDENHPNPAMPGEVRYFAMGATGEVEVPGPEPVMLDGELVKPKSRTFFPARVEDNPIYMKTGYRETLQALPEPLRSQMLRGDFRAGLEDSAWQVIPTRWVQAAQVRHKQGRPKGEDGKPLPLSGLGADIACGGDDRTVLAPLYDVWFAPLLVYAGKETPDGESAAALIVAALGSSKAKPNVDIIGVGQGVRTALKIAKVAFNEINFANSSYAYDKSGKLRFANVRAEAYWKFREALDPESGKNLALPEDRELLAELCAARWSLEPEGIKLEKKEKIVKRLGRSPDKADAVVLAWYQAEVAGSTGNPWG